jgi:diguanylate cyclase (GGDEF)-like protein/PAS domain S-box-containing protein
MAFDISEASPNPLESSALALIASLPAAVFVFVDDRIAYANAAGAMILGASTPHEVVGERVMDFVHPLDHIRTIKRLNRVTDESATNPPTTIRVFTCTGALRSIAVTSSPVRFSGQPGVLVVAMDITRATGMDDTPQHDEHNLRRLFENMQDVYYRTDASGVVQMVGPAVRQVLGYEPEEIIGKTAEAFYPNPNDRDALKAAIRDHGQVSDFHGQMVRKDGRIIDISINTDALYDENGDFAGVEGIYRDVTERKNLERQLQHLASRDPLTDITNRRAFLEEAEHWLQRSRRQGSSLVLLMLDIDHFKAINDRHGHAAGDEVLIAFTRTVGATLRGGDLFGRLGGEEFAVALLAANRREVQQVVERIRKRVQTLRFDARAGTAYGVTVSIGGARSTPSDLRLEQVLERADQGLYDAKKGGRDRFVWRSSRANDRPERGEEKSLS